MTQRPPCPRCRGLVLPREDFTGRWLGCANCGHIVVDIEAHEPLRSAGARVLLGSNAPMRSDPHENPAWYRM